MAMYEVKQVDGSTGEPRRSVTVDESKVTGVRNWMNGRAAKVEAESSDWVSAKEA